MFETWHIYPRDDFYEHITVGSYCWCHPVIEEDGSDERIIHNSMDGRELIERGERMIQ